MITWQLIGRLHASLVCNSAPQRLARVLANLAAGIGQKVPGGVELDVRNEELANEANISPFTASRLLSAWQREGILVKRRGKVLLRYPYRLSQHDISTSASLSHLDNLCAKLNASRLEKLPAGCS